MSDSEALLAAIIANPADDTPRLIYADWLEENDRVEEAEFIRVQCRLASLPPDAADYPELLERNEELRLWLTAHVPGPRLAFPAGLSIDGGNHWWRRCQRGFPAFISFDGTERPGTRSIRRLAAALEQAFQVVPTRWLVVNHVTVAQLAALVRHPVIAGLTHLTVQLADAPDASHEAARVLAHSRHWRQLRWLRLAFSLTEAACAELAAAPWAGLETLLIDGDLLTPAGFLALADSEWFRNLREFGLLHCQTDETFERLVRLPPLPQLHTLDLSFSDLSTGSWEIFASTRSFPRLAVLHLDESDLSEGRWENLTRADGFTLRVLQAVDCPLSPGAGTALTAAPWASSLRILNLSGSWLSSPDVYAIVKCRKFGQLRHLNLAYAAFSPRSLAALAANPALRDLCSLNIQGSRYTPQPNRGLTARHLEAFLARVDWPQLRRLELSHRPVGPKAVEHLTHPKFMSLRRLGLNNCRLTEAAAKKLLTAATLSQLIELGLRENRLAKSLELLADRSVLPRLSACSLLGNALSRPLARKLRRRPGLYV
ncbi:MAG: TIGR02996 domain-containing protein [Gemmataceae bacterium]|nr:TIGR02996 domain-containing protein [Gemmata sp.]MDW8198842.1 TIGR02996 domain-containing protein [Gemmataceae bacterium]